MSNKAKIKVLNLTSLDQLQAEANITTIKDAIDRIFKLESSQLSFEELYRNAYNLVLNKYGPKLYAAVKEKITSNIKLLEQEIKSFDIISNVARMWAKYTVCLNTVKDVHMYMDKNYCEKNSLPTVQQMGYELFKQIIIHTIGHGITNEVIDKIKQYRMGNYIDMKQIKDITLMLLTVGGTELYQEVIEKDFVKTSTEYFASQVSIYLGKEKCPEFANRVNKRLDDEKKIVDECLEQKTYHLIEERVLDEYISKNSAQLLCQYDSGVSALLTNGDYTGMQVLYSVFSMEAEAKNALILSINSFFTKEIEKSISMIKQEGNNNKFISALFKIKDMFSATYNCCQKDEKYYFKMKEAIESSISRYTTSFALAKYCNDLFKPTCRMQDKEIEDAILASIDLFRLISDKDAFELHYRTLFAKRMLSVSSYNISDYEKSLISRLKTECGCNYTSRIDNMALDIEISEKLKKDFIFTNPNIEFNIKIISCGNWPISTESTMVILPPAISSLESHFMKYYQRIHNGRVVNFLPNLGNCTVSYHTKQAKKYDINMSTMQTVIIMLFNSLDTLSISRIMTLTNIKYDDALREISSFLKVKLFTPSSEEINEDTAITLNKDFSSKLFSITLPVLKTVEGTAKEDDRSVEQLNESRKVVADAYIVKVMKTRKKMEHNALMSEVLKYLSIKFKPDIQFIKLRIEAMIEREYLERSKDEKGVYIYKS